MATATPAPLDMKALAKGIGTVKQGAGYDRIIVGKKTLAYVKRGTVTVPAALIKGAPKKLGRVYVESNGKWAGVKVADTAAARAVLEHVVAKAGQV